MRVVMEAGGALEGSARNAPQMMPLFAVARTRAEPLEINPAPKVPSTESPAAPFVPKSTVAPATTLSDVALGSFAAAPPAGPKTSIPTRMGAPVVFVQGKKVSRTPIPITPGTDQRWKDACPWSAGGGESICACATVAMARATGMKRTCLMGHLRRAIVAEAEVSGQRENARGDGSGAEGDSARQFAAFCFSFAMMVSWAIDVGGALPVSAMNTVHASFFDVARIRAEPLVEPPTLESIVIPTADDVP